MLLHTHAYCHTYCMLADHALLRKGKQSDLTANTFKYLQTWAMLCTEDLRLRNQQIRPWIGHWTAQHRLMALLQPRAGRTPLQSKHSAEHGSCRALAGDCVSMAAGH